MTIPADHTPGPPQGLWIYDDYATLPNDGHRYEIVDGVLYMAPAPNEWHQTATGRLFRYLASYIEDAGHGRVYIAPFDVELGPGSVLQPDVLVILNAHRERITFSRIVGAPDLVVEVVSPGSVGYDRTKKQNAYARAGVPEYWIADPWSRTIEVLTLEADGYRSLGVFEGKAKLPSEIVPDFPVQVERFFA
ncbi:MAG TPA: Uma2 family endonuclease [Ktedonobacteraceae bacterium]|nr:Uma2 family endonuclease [Ktedonobacteraceae bacterium]